MQYITLARMRIQGANIYNTAFLMGGPPVLPAYFMAHALGRKLYMPEAVRSVALTIHDYTPLGDTFYGVFNPQQRRSASFTFGPSQNSSDYSSKNKHALSLQPVATAHMQVSLIIGFKEEPSLEDIRKHVLGGRFSGGIIMSLGALHVSDDIEEALTKLKNGFVVMDRRDLLENKNAQERAQAFVNALGHISHGDDGLAWLSATCLGYANISPYARRGGAREGYEHAFAEPLAGLVQYLSVRQCLEEDRAKEALWRPEWLADDVFRVLQKTNS